MVDVVGWLVGGIVAKNICFAVWIRDVFFTWPSVPAPPALVEDTKASEHNTRESETKKRRAMLSGRRGPVTDRRLSDSKEE